MESQGIYTLANDVVFDQLVALLNSIEVNVGSNIPVCVIPYDDRLEKVKREINARANVTLYENYPEMQRWEEFAKEVWAAHPRATQSKKKIAKWYNKSNLLRKMCAFDGEFEEFVFYDADSLAMKPLDQVFTKLEEYDFVFDDWEHAKRKEVAAFNFDRVYQDSGLTESEVRSKIHCSSFFGSRAGIFGVQELETLKKRLIEHREIEWINSLSWWCDADLFSYMSLVTNRPIFNFTRSSNGEERTGNCANADPFVNIDNVLYNQDGLKPIHRIHYMGYSSVDFGRLSQGEDVHIPYQDVFLHYRFLKHPEQKPTKLKPPSLFEKANRFVQRSINKLKKV
ncbi:Npun_R2821/Npun_R2822 family protein [Limnoraphis robusta]|uniref:Methionine synthase n=2 Tax=Limnoraphis robusta TaxID=1118279 RepID=A0A0F5YFP7_9CYAN|nr:Npun_R2821/Npun_R2822 family protein [Limnoraphis robusta]KKD37696.1 methionine synthase [Limnoraphis robusta CS-951]KMW70160.1 methionine synthase [Limnoraphis robusta CS-951]MEA5519169.1 hypothetical protein [Limnoraphis robusta CCNP1315]MEA5546991.1 hypothetical protein [Limnoraphis robusta CCNP1324]